MDRGAGQRDVRMWIYPTKEQTAFAADLLAKNEPIGIKIVSKDFELVCPTERLE
jgi:hypothetical protein